MDEILVEVLAYARTAWEMMCSAERVIVVLATIAATASSLELVRIYLTAPGDDE